jgi:hypothetical protein
MTIPLDSDEQEVVNRNLAMIHGNVVLGDTNYTAQDFVVAWKGAYNSIIDYAILDGVEYLGDSYVMYANAPAGTLPTNTTYWQLFSEEGATGPIGAPGGAVQEVDASLFASFALCVADASTNGKQIVVGTAMAVTDDLTVPATRSLRFVKGGSLTITSGKVLTINGPLEAGNYKIFNGVTSGQVIFGAYSCEKYSLRWFVDGDGSDATVGTQALVDALPDAAIMFVPEGDYLITSSIVLDSTSYKRFIIEGMGRLSYFHGDIATPIFTTNNVSSTRGGPYGLSRLRINNINSAGEVLKIYGVVGASVENCVIEAKYRGLYFYDCFSILVKNSTIQSSTHAPGSVGIIATSHVTILSCDIVGWDHGIRTSKSAINIIGCRLEVNHTALMLGMGYDGATVIMTSSLISGNTFEANDVAIHILSVGASVISSASIYGTVNAPSGNSSRGIYYGSGTYNTIESIAISGEFIDAAIVLGVGTATDNPTFIGVVALNSLHGTVQDWKVLRDIGYFTFINCNFNPNKYGSSSTPGTYPGVKMSDVYINSIMGTDYTNNALLPGRNISRLSIALGNGASSYDVEFPIAWTSGSAQINTATAIAGGSLPDGTYYYSATLVTPLGETGYTVSLEKTVTTSGGDNTARIVFFGLSSNTFKWRRRVYRGTAPGVYDGYYELAMNSSATFDDTGEAFTVTGKTIPDSGAAPLSGAEPDANYAVFISTSWATTAVVSLKATTGFTVTFGTVTPDANQTFDYFIVR